MKRTKMITLLILLALCATFLSGCPIVLNTEAMSDADFYNLDAQAFCANYKQDRVCEWGKKAAVYQGQIFYSDPAGGGIFAMNTDGSQCQLSIECPDIRKLQFTEDGVYYLGFAGNLAFPKQKSYRSFRLFRFDANTQEHQNMVESAKDANVPELDLELWDFYRTPQGNIAFQSVYNNEHMGSVSFSLYLSSPQGLVTDNEVTWLCNTFKNPQKDVPGSQYISSLGTAAYVPLVFSCHLWFIAKNPDDLLPGPAFSVADQEKNQLVLNTATAPNVAALDDHLTIDSFCPEGVLVHIKNEIMLTTSNFQNTVRSIVLDEEDSIRFVVVCRGKAYMIAEAGEKGEKQSVYEIDLNTFDYQKLYTCAQDTRLIKFGTMGEERILWLDAEKLVTVQEKTIRIWSLTDGHYQLNRTLETAENVVAKINKTDVAGDWLFVYRFSEENNRDELVEKLNIAVE